MTATKQIESDFLTNEDFQWPGSDFARAIIPLVLPAKRQRSKKSVWDYRYFQTKDGLYWTTDNKYFWQRANPLLHLLIYIYDGDYDAATPQELPCSLFWAGIQDDYYWNTGSEFESDYGKLWQKMPDDEFGSAESRDVGFDHLVRIYHYQAEHSGMDLDKVGLAALMKNDELRRQYVQDFMSQLLVKNTTLDQLDASLVQLYQQYQPHL